MGNLMKILIKFAVVCVLYCEITQICAVSTPQFPVDFMPFTIKEAVKWGEKVGLSRHEVKSIMEYRTKYNEGATIGEKMDAIQGACEFIAQRTSIIISDLYEPSHIQDLRDDILGLALKMDYWEKIMKNTENDREKMVYLVSFTALYANHVETI